MKPDQNTDYAAGAMLLINKPKTWTSFDVVKKVKGLVRCKVGHAGTLDPMATGLLVLCTGAFTKKLTEFTDYDKAYEGTLTLGACTPSFDSETEPSQKFPTTHINKKMISETLDKFRGDIHQVPPIYSALKHKGQPMYKLAREGTAPVPKSRKVTVSLFEISKFNMPELDFKVECSKGTYVRSLAHDLGKALQSGAYLSSLCRTRVGPYLLKDAWEIEELQQHIESQKQEIQG